MKSITDHRSLIDALGGNKVLAGNLKDCTPSRVGQWKIGNRIPPEYWPEVIRLAGSAGLDGISADWLVANLRPRLMPSPQAAAE